MGWFDEFAERTMLAVAKRASGKQITALAVALYAGLGLFLPIVLGSDRLWLVALNVIGTSFAGALIIVWVTVRVQETQRRNLLEWTTDLRHLDAEEFEWLVGEVFRREGWVVEETGSQSGPDGNVDLRLTRAGERRIVQCKRWTSWNVGVDTVRAFAGTIMRERLSPTGGVFVTLSGFTQQARDEAKDMGITLIDGSGLLAKVEKVRRPEPCPKCGAPMVLDRSVRGWWLRCARRGCDGKRDLGPEPARAIELLTRVS